MPQIQIKSWNSKTTESKWSDIDRILSIMCFPKKQDQHKERDQLVSCFLASRILNSNGIKEFLDKVSTPNDHTPLELLIKTLLHSPAFSDLKEKVAAITYKADVAGEILRGIFRFNETLPTEHLGVKKSSFLLSNFGKYQTQDRMKDGKKVKVPKRIVRKLGKSTVENYWEEYKSVAHFYAALRFYPGKGRQRKINWNLLTPDKFLDFIVISNKIVEFGIKYIPKHGQREPLISKGDVWTIDTNVPLPKIELKFPPTPRWVKEALKQYKAPRSNS